jgi:hypothetical protein
VNSKKQQIFLFFSSFTFAIVQFLFHSMDQNNKKKKRVERKKNVIFTYKNNYKIKFHLQKKNEKQQHHS